MEPETQTEQTQSPVSKQDSGIGAIVGSIVVVLIIIVGAFYLFTLVQDRRQEQLPVNEAETDTMVDEEPATTAELEAELQTINTEELDAELDAIEASF